MKVETERGHKSTTPHACTPDLVGHRLVPTSAADACPQFLCIRQTNITSEQSLLSGLHTLFRIYPRRKFLEGGKVRHGKLV